MNSDNLNEAKRNLTQLVTQKFHFVLTVKSFHETKTKLS